MSHEYVPLVHQKKISLFFHNLTSAGVVMCFPDLWCQKQRKAERPHGDMIGGLLITGRINSVVQLLRLLFLC